jgi:accessory gene regulator protein AgrB
MINIQLNNIKKYSLAFLAFGVLIYGAVYLQALNGEAFHFVESKAFNSKNLDALVGKVKTVELSPFGSYHEKYIDDDQIILMEVKIIGELKTVKIQIKLMKTHEIWQIKVAEIDGKPFSFDSPQ